MLVAVGASLGLLAILSSSSDDFEDAGQTGVEARCAPNEVWDQELDAKGIGGPESKGGIRSRRIGCRPYCGTWEYFSAGKNDKGEYEPTDPPTAMQSSIGGPEGKGGVFSQNIGCFAPCYWDYIPPDPQFMYAALVKGTGSSLTYYDDNRFPIVRQVRLGVNYRRSVDPSVNPSDISNARQRQRVLGYHVDLRRPLANQNRDRQFFIHTQLDFRGRTTPQGGGSRQASGSPLHPEQIANGFPTVFKPNWRSGFGNDPDSPPRDPGDTARNGTTWEDENWEIRADPINKVCTIVNITLDDEVVCSSEWQNCGTPS